MSDFVPRDPGYEARARESFGRQAMMRTLGIEIEAVAPGSVNLAMAFDQRFTQQHGFLHAATVTAGMDTACGFAAFTLMEADAGVLTIEFKVNLLAPARGDRFRFSGQVVKPGRTILVTEGRAVAIEDGDERLIATMSATMMAVTGRSDVKG